MNIVMDQAHRHNYNVHCLVVLPLMTSPSQTSHKQGTASPLVTVYYPLCGSSFNSHYLVTVSREVCSSICALSPMLYGLLW